MTIEFPHATRNKSGGEHNSERLTKMQSEDTYFYGEGRHNSALLQLTRNTTQQRLLYQEGKNPAAAKLATAYRIYQLLHAESRIVAVAQFQSLFGISSSLYRLPGGGYSRTMLEAVERRMDALISEAAAEQRVAL